MTRLKTARVSSCPGWLLTIALASGCATGAGGVRFGSGDPARPATGLAPCGVRLDRSAPAAELDPDRPLTVIVHGCNSSGGRFKTLAGVFEAHGQQTVCFNYDDRDRIDAVASDLAASLGVLERNMNHNHFTVVGHSQGGLVSRRALTKLHRTRRSPRTDMTYDLVTVSSPFGGIQASRDCALTWLHVVTLGFTAAVCQGIAGDIWREIFPGAPFIENPGPLSSAVQTHLVVRTDERGTCRRRQDGRCVEDDFVFSLDEQANARVDAISRAAVDTVPAGHVEIVGERGRTPTKLIQVLRARMVLMPLNPPQRRVADKRIARLYRKPGA